MQDEDDGRDGDAVDAPVPGPRAMSREQRREYDRRKKAESRARLRKAMWFGDIPPHAHNVTQALADAAVMVLRDGGAGAEAVREALKLAFARYPGTVEKIEADIAAGRLGPKVAKTRFVVPPFLRPKED